MDLIHELHRQGNTIMLITHDTAIAREAERQVQLMDGKIVSDTARISASAKTEAADSEESR